ncbi:MAG: HpcH/HpaI aldolase/citrate lyase family protein [Mycobacterium sp.]
MVRHFGHLGQKPMSELFLLEPRAFDDGVDRQFLAVALGATLYVPATRPDLAAAVSRRAAEGVCSMVLDTEDAVGDHEVDAAIANAVAALGELAGTPAGNALVFVRVRGPEAIPTIAAAPGAKETLTGFVIPKFNRVNGMRYLDAVADASRTVGKHLYAMPVLESTELIYRETRVHELGSVASLLAGRRDQVLAVRVGATDMCGAFGIRRDRDLTIYDVRVVADVIADIVNYLGRADGGGFVITGPVWEYFADRERMFIPMLRTTPFVDHDAVRFRNHMIDADLDGFLREVALDRANGMQGKSVIHPTHVAAVHALSAVTHEEYHDALDIVDSAAGAKASGYRNKMNETKPHRNWARQTLLRAEVFGVMNTGVTFVDLLTAWAGK